MSETSANNKRIAKNTIALYFRTFITMIVGLYTGRVMFQALGVNDYGINAVVGGIIGMSSLITSTMSAAISRYITFALGKGDKERLKVMFSTSINAQIIIAVLAVIFLEVIGVWFLVNKATIPPERMNAAYWVLHCSVITLVINLVSSPFNAVIIAHERMSIYAYTSIFEAALKLGICFLIMWYGGDRLILFAILHIATASIMRIFYGWYCGRNFEEAHYRIRTFDKGLLKELSVFSGWNLLNNGAAVFATQGVSMLINAFFGVVFNASRQLANQVSSAVQSFVNNFSTAFSPQITKTYAAGDSAYSIRLVNKSTKFTWLMMYILIVPVCMEAEMLLQLWLGQVPEMAPLFLQLAMFESLVVSSGSNLFKLIQADGHVKKYTIHAAITAGMIFPAVWITYKLGAPVWTSYSIFIVVFLILNIVRIYDIKRLMEFSVRQFFKETITPCLFVSVTSFIVPIVLAYFMEDGNVRFFVMIIVSVLWTCLCCILFGLTNNERHFFISKVKQLLKNSKE